MGTLDSKSAYAGQPVVLTNVATRDGSVSGATLYGMVTDVTHPGSGRNAQIRIHFETLRFANGTSAPVDGVVASMQVNTKSNAAKEVGGALVGMLIGNAVAKTILGVSGGGVVGAIGGYVIAKDSRADVTIPAQTAITVRLAGPRRQEPPVGRFVDRVDAIGIKREVVLDRGDRGEWCFVRPHGVDRALPACRDAVIVAVTFIGAVGTVIGPFQQRHVDVGARDVQDRRVVAFVHQQCRVRVGDDPAAGGNAYALRVRIDRDRMVRSGNLDGLRLGRRL